MPGAGTPRLPHRFDYRGWQPDSAAAGIVAASGLKLGEAGDTAIFDAARDRLLATGYFETVAYRFRDSAKGVGYDVSFDVQEMQPLYSIHLEALAASTEEVVGYVKTKDPLFTGRIPGTRQVLGWNGARNRGFSNRRTGRPRSGAKS